jgi:beta-galactosidase
MKNNKNTMNITLKRALSSLAVAFAIAPAFAQRDTVNVIDWQFSRSTLTPATATQGDGIWKAVRLPHDFLVEQPWVAPAKDEKADNSDLAANVKSRLSARGFKEMGIGWYRRTFTPDASWKGRRVDLEVGGIMLVGDVYLNGQRIGGTEYGYLGFGIDVSNLLKYGQENTLVVKADTRNPNNSRWYTGAGLYRDVKFIITPKTIYFDRHPLYITTSDNKTVHVQATIANYGKDKTGKVNIQILDAQGRVVANSDNDLQYQRMKKSNEYKLNDISLANAHLWDLDDPYLYTVVATVTDNNGKVLDRVSDTFGMRTIEFGPQFGFKLNGKKVLLKGIANHHTLGALGAAAYPRAIEKRIQLLKSFGFNHIRCSHNPYSEDLYKLADKYGMLVIDEAYDKWTTQYGGGRQPWIEHWQYDIPEWVQRDRNHPSVVLWSLGNELQQIADLPFGDWGVTPYKLLRTLVHRYDSTRLTTVAMHPRFRNWQTDSLPCDLAMNTDIQAYNYRYMYFPGDGRRFPWMTFYQSEANLAMMGPNWFGMDLSKVVGAAYWGMIDYIGESHGWPKKGSDGGVFDTSLQPKPRAWLIKSMFSSEPTVHIGVILDKGEEGLWNGIKTGTDNLTDFWNLTPGKTYSLYTFTNCDEVELRLNGKSLGVKKNSTDPNSRDKIRWNDIPYEAGTLEAVARNNGKVVARHAIHTAGEVKKLTLTPDKSAWKADGMDLMHIRVKAVDKNGVQCPQASDMLTFSVDGDAEIVAVDNGDIASNEPFIGNKRSLYHGSALVILRSGTQGGKVKVTVTDGQRKATTTIAVTDKG